MSGQLALHLPVCTTGPRQLTPIKVGSGVYLGSRYLLPTSLHKPSIHTRKVSRHLLGARSRVSKGPNCYNYDSPCSEPPRGSRQLGHVPCRGGTSNTGFVKLATLACEEGRGEMERGDWGRRARITPTHDSSLTHAIIGRRP